MLSHLTNRWTYITQLYKSGELGEDITDTQEVIEDMLNRSLTREYLELLKVAMVGGSLVTLNNTSDTGTGVESAMNVNEESSMDSPAPAMTRATQNAMASDVINDLGAKLLRYPYTSSPIVMTVLRYF